MVDEDRTIAKSFSPSLDKRAKKLIQIIIIQHVIYSVGITVCVKKAVVTFQDGGKTLNQLNITAIKHAWLQQCHIFTLGVY